MNLQLICEGRCNHPAIIYIDETIKAFTDDDLIPNTRVTEDGREMVVYQRGNSALWRAQRALRYTEHIPSPPDHAFCAECGTRRRYGHKDPSIPVQEFVLGKTEALDE